jgi:hypothetical protein
MIPLITSDRLSSLTGDQDDATPRIKLPDDRHFACHHYLTKSIYNDLFDDAKHTPWETRVYIADQWRTCSFWSWREHSGRAQTSCAGLNSLVKATVGRIRARTAAASVPWRKSRTTWILPRKLWYYLLIAWADVSQHSLKFTTMGSRSSAWLYQDDDTFDKRRIDSLSTLLERMMIKMMMTHHLIYCRMIDIFCLPPHYLTESIYKDFLIICQ